MLAATSDAPRIDGRFTIEGELARGGMGAVFSAIDESNGRRVALKRLAPSAPPRAAVLFEREFYVLSSLRHPRIIEVHDYGVDAEGPYYTMELLDGSDLREVSPVEPALACRYLRDVASSLALLHARRLLHRDVSPRNVRTLPGGGCKLIDFGALMSFGSSEDLVGTPPAIPPEALSGEPMDQRADLFSLGALAYYLLTGRHAYPARKVSELAEVWTEKVVPPSRYAEGVSPELDKLVLALLSLDQLGRPSSASEVIGRLQLIGGLEPEHDERAARAYFVGASLVERARDLERVERRLSRSKTTGGSSIFVEAPPGVGKTRFLGEAALKAELGGTLVLRADASSHGGRFATARALVQQLLRLSPKIAAGALSEHTEALRAVWPELVSDLESSSAVARAPNAERARSFPSVLEACFLAVAQKTPLLVAVDNVDRADLESVAMLLALARAARKGRLVVLVTATVEQTRELSAAARALREAGTSIRLRELTSDGVAELVRVSFGGADHARRMAKRLFTATDGNPGRCMQLLRSFVDDGLIHYDQGAWTLPLEIPDDKLESAGSATADKLRNRSEDARRIAAIIALRDASAPLDWLVMLEDGHRSSRQVMVAVEELVNAEILVEGTEGYSFALSLLRAATLESTEKTLLSALHIQLGDALLAAALTAPERIVAGHHLIRGGSETRGAVLISHAAREILSGDAEPSRILARASRALEAALAVYRSRDAGSLVLLGILVPLVIASYEIAPAYASRYAGETLERLSRALGTWGESGYTPPPDLGGLLSVLQHAPYLEEGEARDDGAPDVMTLVSWLISVVITLVAVAAAVIDHEAQERYMQSLLPFTLLGPDHPASFAHDYCRLIASLSRDYLADSYAGWTRMFARLDEVPLPRQLARRIRRSSIYALGLLECQKDDSSALTRIRQLDESGESLTDAFGNQLRYLFYGFRGEIELAQRYRDRVEEYAVQFGSAWQVEIWSTCTASAFYANTRDAAGNKRVLEQLERLKKTSPSLEIYWERALAGHYLLSGAPERAVETFGRTLARPGARERIGWSTVRGGWARAHNALGKHDEAKRICEETLASCRNDFDFVSLTFSPRIELCRALTGLGDVAGAKAKLEELLEQFLPNEHPTSLGSIYAALAEVAIAEDDTPAFDAHLANMRRCYAPTKNPALIAQCDQLKNAMRANGAWGVAVPAIGQLASNSQTFVQSVFASCHGEASRKQRALELAANQAGVREAWLFTAGDGGSVAMTGRLGAAEAPEELLLQVRELFADARGDTDETELVQSTPLLETTIPVRGTYRLLPLTVKQGDNRILVGAIAVPVDAVVRPVSHDLLQDIAGQLFAAGDVATVRTFC